MEIRQELFKQKRTTLNQTAAISIIILGLVLVIISMFYASSFLAILGVALFFWGAIFLYITPTKHVPWTLLNASAETAATNIERLISELNLTEKGVYLPPKNLKNIESSLIFIPETIKTPLPTPEETNEKLLTNEKTGAFITPPGSSLSCLFSSFLHSFLNEGMASKRMNIKDRSMERTG